MGNESCRHRHSGMAVNMYKIFPFYQFILTFLSFSFCSILHTISGFLSSWLSYFSTQGQRHRKKEELEEARGVKYHYNKDMGMACPGMVEEGKNGTELGAKNEIPEATKNESMKRMEEKV